MKILASALFAAALMMAQEPGHTARCRGHNGKTVESRGQSRPGGCDRDGFRPLTPLNCE